jgi:hypothetical protein
VQGREASDAKTERFLYRRVMVIARGSGNAMPFAATNV